MTVLIECTTPSSQYRWVLRHGESARVGRSPWVEFCVADDSELLDSHLSMEYQNGLYLCAFEGANFEIDGRKTQTTSITRTSSLRTGQSVFRFVYPNSRSESRDPIESVSSSTTTTTDKKWSHQSIEIAEASLSSQGFESIADCVTPMEAIATLQSMGYLEDAVRLIASVSPIRAKLEWCVDALESIPCIVEPATRQAVQDWLDQPSESTRTAIATLIRWDDRSDPWTWVLAAIAWTSGSLGPTDAATIAPPSQAIVSAVIAAMQLAASLTDPTSFRRYCIASQSVEILYAPSRPSQ